MIDLGEAIARPIDRRRAAVVAAAFVLPALFVAPVVTRPAGASYPLFAIVLSISTVMVVLAAVLLWTQARVTQSVPLLGLATLYSMTAAVMTPYLFLYHGLWPTLAAFVSADPQTSAWLWLEWHLLFAATPLAYIILRRRGAHVEPASFERLQRRAVVIAVAAVAAMVPPVIWIDGLPAFSHNGNWTVLGYAGPASVVVLAGIALAALCVLGRLRSILDIWLAVATGCLIADVVVSRFGVTQFTIGWYLSRAYVLVACSCVLTALIVQAAEIYAQLGAQADRLLDESLTDPLTGIANRRSFDARLAQIMADGSRNARPASLLIIDVDEFKAYNDTFGHPVGDRCLQRLSSTIRECVSRASDVAARIGGEEFAIVMADTDLSGAMLVAERVRAAIEDLRLPHAPRATHAVVTVSLGIAALANAANGTAESLMSAADRNLYQAKRNGRNCAVSSAVFTYGEATG